MIKICTSCKQVLQKTDFSPKTKNKLHPTCKDCRSKEQHNTYLRYKQKYKDTAKKHNLATRTRNGKYITEYKEKSGCLRCGEKDSVALDCHHVNPANKSYNVTTLGKMTYSIETIELELKKCVILCANCHRKLHSGRFLLEELGINVRDFLI